MVMTLERRTSSRKGSGAGNSPPGAPLWLESLWAADWLGLRLSEVYRGHGVPEGDGGPVITVPGFMCPDAYMLEMNQWLRRIGYKPYLSGIGFNGNCPGVLAERLSATVQHAAQESGRRVRIIGHSLGGILGKRVSIERPELVSQLIFLGTPLQAIHAHPQILAASTMMIVARSLVRGHNCRCFTSECECGFTEALEAPLPPSVRHASIFTKKDGVVDWHDAQERHPRLNHEVGGTHIGLPYNARAYKAIAHILQDRRRPV
jgi:triacylglycerol lipase